LQLLTDPTMLFCDEPTSGLDSFMAEQVVRCMRRLADQGKTIITTIHQPSSKLFTLFHKYLHLFDLLQLSSCLRFCFLADGYAVFYGRNEDVCPFFVRYISNSITFNKFFSTGRPCAAHFNPTDHAIKLLSIGDEVSKDKATIAVSISVNFHL